MGHNVATAWVVWQVSVSRSSSMGDGTCLLACGAWQLDVADNGMTKVVGVLQLVREEGSKSVGPCERRNQAGERPGEHAGCAQAMH